MQKYRLYTLCLPGLNESGQSVVRGGSIASDSNPCLLNSKLLCSLLCTCMVFDDMFCTCALIVPL